MLTDSIKNIFSRLRKFKVNKLILLLLAVALCAIALAIVICYVMSTAHPPVNIEVNLHLTENYAISNPILGAAAGLVGSVINWQSQREANKMNMKINQMNNEFNRVEAEKQRNWQSVEWLKQFNAQNAYNDPQNQMARLKLAGINPFIAAENTTKIGSTAANPSVPSAASASAASPLAMRAPNFDFMPLVQMAQAASLMADAKNKGVNTEMLEKNLDTWLQTNQADLERLNLTNSMQSLQNGFEAEFGRSRRTYELSLVANQAMLALAQEGEAIANKSVLEKKIDEIIAHTDYERAEKDWLIEQKPYLIKKIKTETETSRKQGEMYEKQGNAALTNAESGRMSALASAARDWASAQTENEKRQWVVENARYLAWQARDDWKLFAQSMQEEFNLKYWQVEAIKANIENMSKSRDLQEKQIYAGIISSIISASTKVGPSK